MIPEYFRHVDDNSTLPSDDAAQLQRLFDRLIESAIMFRMHFSPTKGKTLVRNWHEHVPSITLYNETLEVVGEFT